VLWLGIAQGAAAEVRLPNGEYTETVEDLSVKVLGGFVGVQRSWTNGRWYVNPAWADLRLTFDSLDGTVKALDRAGSIYERAGNGVFIFDDRFFIQATAGGFRWYDQQGNWITYDATGHLTAFGDRNNVQVKFLLDASGRRTQVLDNFNNSVLTFQYSGSHLASVTDRTGRTVQYIWSGNNLVSVIDVLGFSTTYTYDGNGQVTSRTDPEGRKTTIVYAQSTPASTDPVGMRGYLANNPTVSSGIVAKAGSAAIAVASTGSTPRDYKIARVFTVTDPEGNVTTYLYGYDRVSLRYTVTEKMPGGRQIDSTYDREGYLLQRTSGTGRQLSVLRRDGSRIDILTDERGLVTRIEYDAARRPTKTTYPDGTSVTTTYDSVYGNPLTRINEAGTSTLYQYDAKGNLLKMTEAAGLPEERTTTYSYDQFGQRLTLTVKGTTPADDATTSYAYDVYGNRIRQTNPLGDSSQYTHDVMGNVTVAKDPRGNDWTATYNAKGWMLTRSDPLNQVVAYAYDRVGIR
jgi:YD repeat-containing protein